MQLRIFVIDDEECIRDTMKWLLEEQGHEVLTASEPLLCELYQEHECTQEFPCGDILFIDYKMPRMTGLEFIELMSQRGCQSPAENKILMSGNINEIDMKKAQQLGCQVVEKPLPLTVINKLIEQAKTRISPERTLIDLSAKTAPID